MLMVTKSMIVTNSGFVNMLQTTVAPELSALVTYIEPAPLGNLADRIKDVKVRVACQNSTYLSLIEVFSTISFSLSILSCFSTAVLCCCLVHVCQPTNRIHALPNKSCICFAMGLDNISYLPRDKMLKTFLVSAFEVSLVMLTSRVQPDGYTI